MRRLSFLIAAALFGIAGLASAQESFLPKPPGQIESILELLDAVEFAEAEVLGDAELSDRDVEELRELTRVADTIGAEDLAARARSLLVLARPSPETAPDQPSVETPLAPAPRDAFVRGSDRFRTFTNIVGATGATALVLSAGFYALAERDYQRWLVAGSEEEGTDLFRAWHTYDALSLGLGGGALLTVGIGIPLLYSLAAPPASFATPPAREAYTEVERAARLNELYGERAQIVTELNRYDERGPRRELATTIGLATGAVGTLASITLYYVAEARYQRYLEAPFSDDAEQLGRQVQLFDALSMSSAAIAAAGFGTSAGVSILTQNRRELEDALREVNRRIITVRNAPTVEVPDRGSVQYVLEPDEQERTGGTE